MSQQLSRTYDASGQIKPAFSFSPGPQFGDGVFETMLVVGGQIVNRGGHFHRLSNGLDLLKIPVDLALLRDITDSLIEHVEVQRCYRLRLQVARGMAEQYRGYYCDNPEPLISIKAIEISAPVPTTAALMLSSVKLSRNPSLAGIKHCSRLEYVLASLERQKNESQFSPDVDDMLLVDSESFVVETTTANLFFLIAGQWVTPSLSEVGVLGTVRQELLKNVLPALDIECRVETVTLDRLMDAEAVFLCNALKGVVSVDSLRLSSEQVVTFSGSPQLDLIQATWFSRLDHVAQGLIGP